MGIQWLLFELVQRGEAAQCSCYYVSILLWVWHGLGILSSKLSRKGNLGFRWENDRETWHLRW